MAVFASVLLGVSYLMLTMVIPFAYVYRGGKLVKGVLLSWGMAVLWNFVVSQVVYDYVWRRDRELTEVFPEGNALVGAVCLGWLGGLIVCWVAVGTRRLMQRGKGKLSERGMTASRQVIDRIRDRLARNCRGYVREFRVWLVLTVVACAADMASTMYFMGVHGAEAELHPAIRVVSVVLGPIAGPILGKVCQFVGVVLVTIYLRAVAKYVFLVVIILYTWAAWYNVWGRHLYIPRILRLVPI